MSTCTIWVVQSLQDVLSQPNEREPSTSCTFVFGACTGGTMQDVAGMRTGVPAATLNIVSRELWLHRNSSHPLSKLVSKLDLLTAMCR